MFTKQPFIYIIMFSLLLSSSILRQTNTLPTTVVSVIASLNSSNWYSAANITDVVKTMDTVVAVVKCAASVISRF